MGTQPPPGNGQEETVGILAGRKVNDTRGDTGAVQALGEGSSGLLTGLVFILIEDNVDSTILGIAKLVPLQGRQMSADRTGGVAKAFLPEKCKIGRAHV